MDPRKKGIIFVVSGPSGSGKSTLCREMVRRFPNLRFSISHTTRPVRPGDQEGRDYFFISDEQFQQMIDRGEFYEWAMIYGHRYGTSQKMLEGLRGQGYDVLLDIDTQGARQLREKKVQAVYIFILPPSMAELEQRLSRRKTEEGKSLRERLGTARTEMEEARGYDYLVVNNELKNTQENLQSIIRAEACRKERMIDVLESILKETPKT